MHAAATAAAAVSVITDATSAHAGTLSPSDHIRVTAHKKRERDRTFTNLYRWQSIQAHRGAIRVLEFSRQGFWLATAGADTVVKIWHIDRDLSHSHASAHLSETQEANAKPSALQSRSYAFVRQDVNPILFNGHTSDVTDLSWSKNDFLISGSMDRTLRLWHPRAKACLRRLLQTDMVTSVSFHPTDEQICIAGLCDGVVNMWHLKERKMLSQAETDDMITATAITPDGTTALVGTQHGLCKIFALFDEIQAEWQFKHMTQLDVRSKRQRNASGKKICGFRFFGKGDKVLVSSNDNRLRLYRMDDKSVVCKFSGAQNNEARLNGSFDPFGRYMLCPSETRTVHIWETSMFNNETAAPEATRLPDDDDEDSAAALSKRKDVGVVHESFVVQASGQVTGAVFAPACVPADSMYLRPPVSNTRTAGLVIVTASDAGHLRVFGCC